MNAHKKPITTETTASFWRVIFLWFLRRCAVLFIKMGLSSIGQYKNKYCRINNSFKKVKVHSDAQLLFNFRCQFVLYQFVGLRGVMLPFFGR